MCSCTQVDRVVSILLILNIEPFPTFFHFAYFILLPIKESIATGFLVCFCAQVDRFVSTLMCCPIEQVENEPSISRMEWWCVVFVDLVWKKTRKGVMFWGVLSYVCLCSNPFLLVSWHTVQPKSHDDVWPIQCRSSHLFVRRSWASTEWVPPSQELRTSGDLIVSHEWPIPPPPAFFVIRHWREEVSKRGSVGGAHGSYDQTLYKTFVVLQTTHVRGFIDEVVDACLGHSWVHVQRHPPDVLLPLSVGDECDHTRHDRLQVKLWD